MFKILVAEDDAELRQLFCRVLTRHGFQPIGAADGVEALQVLERDYIDLIVSDIMMPQLDGYALVRGLRDSGSTIPVLMITARDGFQDMQFGFLAGADDYLVKPINVNELVLRINALLRRAQMVADRRQTLGTTTFEFDSFSVLTGGVQTVLPQKEFFAAIQARLLAGAHLHAAAAHGRHLGHRHPHGPPHGGRAHQPAARPLPGESGL